MFFTKRVIRSREASAVFADERKGRRWKDGKETRLHKKIDRRSLPTLIVRGDMTSIANDGIDCLVVLLVVAVNRKKKPSKKKVKGEDKKSNVFWRTASYIRVSTWIMSCTQHTIMSIFQLSFPLKYWPPTHTHTHTHTYIDTPSSSSSLIDSSSASLAACLSIYSPPRTHKRLGCLGQAPIDGGVQC